MRILEAALLTAAAGGALYLALACLRLFVFARRPREYASDFLPSVTILKPVAGLEPELAENLASFCNQEYGGSFDVIFCLATETDSALPVVQEVVRRFPACTMAIAIGNNAAMTNPKIANIAKPGVAPQGEIVVIADSDIRVDRWYLRALAASFQSAENGAATCLYSGTPVDSTLVPRLGALGIDDGFAPSVLVALAVGPLRFCLGATMAVRRSVLEEIGGLEALDTLADDHRLGELVARSGRRVELSRDVVRTTVPERTLSALWSHELRWGRTNSALAPAGYAFSFLTYGLPLALIYFAVSRNVALGLPLLTIVVGLRIALHYLARLALTVSRRDDLLLVPLRDFLSLATWAVSLGGRAVSWRGKRYLATRD